VEIDDVTLIRYAQTGDQYVAVGRRHPCGSGIGALLVPLPGVRGLSSAGEEVDNRLE
jgi:hypothetical protein